MTNGTGNGTIQKIKDKVRNPGRKSFWFLGFSLVGGIGSWMVTVGTLDAVTFASLGGLLGILASLGLAWSGETFINKKP